MCRAKNEELLTNKNQVLARCKEHFEEHWNEGSKSEQQTRPVDLRDDGVDIDLLKYLKNNKTASPDSNVAELLKNGRPNLLDVLHEVIQQAWTSETLPKSWTERVFYPVYKIFYYKKGDKLDCKNYQGICLSNVTNKVFAKKI
jgi:hypothetical protein